MLNNEQQKLDAKSALLNQQNSHNQFECEFDKLAGVLKSIEEQSDHYREAGLTQVSHWLM